MKDEELSPEIWDIARNRAAKCVRHNRIIKGIELDSIADDIALKLYQRQYEILALLAEGKIDAAEAIIRDAERKAESDAANETKKTIRAIIPYQVRQAKETLKNCFCHDGIIVPGKVDPVDATYAAMGREMKLLRFMWCDDARINKCVRFTLKNLSPEDRRIGFLHLELGTWEKVAERMRLSVGDFWRKHLPRFKKNFAAVWQQVW